jgi:predicted exporter
VSKVSQSARLAYAYGEAGVGVLVVAVVGVGAAVALGVGARVGFGVDLPLVASVGVGVNVIAGILVGEIKMIFIALSSGTGERIFLPDTRTPTTIDTRTRTPMISVRAANVLRRSSMPKVYHKSFSRLNQVTK